MVNYYLKAECERNEMKEESRKFKLKTEMKNSREENDPHRRCFIHENWLFWHVEC